MALSSKDKGYIRANEGMPYPNEMLSGFLNIDVELLLRTVEKCKLVGKIVEQKDGTFYLPSWDEFKLSPRHQRRFNFEPD
jgi:hypothetical protein